MKLSCFTSWIPHPGCYTLPEKMNGNKCATHEPLVKTLLSKSYYVKCNLPVDTYSAEEEANLFKYTVL